MMAAKELIRPGMMHDGEIEVAQAMMAFMVGSRVLVAVGGKLYKAAWDSCQRRYCPTGDPLGEAAPMIGPETLSIISTPQSSGIPPFDFEESDTLDFVETEATETIANDRPPINDERPPINNDHNEQPLQDRQSEGDGSG